MIYRFMLNGYSGYKEFKTKKALRTHLEKIITLQDDNELLQFKIKRVD